MDSRPIYSVSLSWRIALLVVLLGASMAFLSPQTMLGRFGVQLSYDASHALAGPNATVAATSEVVLVYLDMESHLREKQSPSSPWDRSLHARLIERLTRAGARAIVFDIIFQDPGTEEVDTRLAAALHQSGRVILAAEIARSSHEPGASTGLRSQSLVLPLNRFLKAAAGIGLANVIPDEDFVVRRAYVGSTSHQQPSLTEAVSRRLQLPAPTGPEPPAWIRYYGRPLALPHVSYSNALDPAGTPDEVFRDRVVFVGARPLTSGFTERRDEFRSPFPSWRNQLFMPAVEIHATQLLNRLRGDGLHRLSSPQEDLALLSSALLLIWVLPSLRPFPAALTALGFGALCLLGFHVAFVQANLWFPWLVIAGVQLPLALGATVLQQSREWYAMRKRLEAARRQAEARIREQAELIDRAQDAILVQDLQGTIRFANPGASRLYGWAAEDFAQPGVSEQLFAPCRALARQARQTTLERNEWQGEMEQATRSGERRIVQSRWTLIRDERQQPKSILSIHTDITEMKQIEAQFLRSQRMEAIGSVAGGMAHDLNNALSPVLLGIQRLQKRTVDDETRRVLSVMEANTHRGAEMVRQVLTFSRGQDGERIQLDPAPLLREMERIILQTFPKSISLGVLLPPDLWRIEGNATQLHQVLLNLCVNARDAMPQGGQLTLAADNVELTPVEAKEIPHAVAGSYVMLLIADTGKGIPAEVLPRLYEPFFTTKPQGQGTGLGLSTSYRIVANHGGFMHIRTELGVGTTFEVYLPRCEKSMGPAESSKAELAPRGQGEWILVAEDERAVRDMLAWSLQEQGYQVVCAPNGAEALALLRSKAQNIQLLLTDNGMPVMDGMRLIQEARAEFPLLPILLMSGEALPEEHGAKATLAKPFDAEALFRLIAQQLTKAAAP